MAFSHHDRSFERINMTRHTPQSTTPKNVQITARQPIFEFKETPAIWLSDPIKTHFMNALSVLIPFSEKTVNEIMRKNIELFHEAKLKKEIQTLIKQEGAHARMHRETNKILAGTGYTGILFFEKIQIRLMSLLRKVSTDVFELAMPAAFEHFTAAISRDFLSHEFYWTNNKENTAIEFSRWHALEELEHQAVCYDAFNSVYNNKYRLPMYLALIWLPVFVISTFTIQLYFLHKDRIVYQPKYWLAYLRFMGRCIKLFSKGIFSYSKVSFSPWSPQDETLYQKSLERFRKH